MERTTHGPPPALIALVQRAFPEKTGCVRRIHALWGNWFRVNYHLVGAGNVIHESHFIQVQDGKVAELN